MSKQLKPCLFCGGTPELRETLDIIERMMG